jgi:MFS family permease
MTARRAKPGRRPSVFAQPGYRRLWAARTVSQWGDVVQFTTMALLVLHLTGSGLGVSGAVVAEILPVLLLAPIAGTLVDRLPRVRVMVVADVARALLAAALALSHGHVALAYAVAFGLSAGSVFFSPAAGSLLPGLVEDDQLVAANSGIWSAAVLSQIVLAPIAGVLAGTVGFGVAFGLNAASFAVSGALLVGLRAREAPRPVASTNFWREGRQALGLLVGDRTLRALALAQGLAALSAGATSALLVVLVRSHLHASPTDYGLALGAIGVGAFVGPLLLTHLRPSGQEARIVFGAFGLRGVVDLLLATVGLLPVALGALAGYGLGTSTGSVSFSSLIQRQVPDATRAKIFSAFDLVWHSARLVSIVAGGALADAYGIQSVYVAAGILLLAAALVGATAFRGEQPRGAGVT